MPGRNFFTIIRPGHHPDKLPQRTRSKEGRHQFLANAPRLGDLNKTTLEQLQRKAQKRKRSSNIRQRTLKFRVKVQNESQAISDEPGSCGNCQLEFDRITSHLRKCHPRLYRRMILALRDAKLAAAARPSSNGDVK